MSDIRRISLDASKSHTVTSVPREQYLLGADRMEDLGKKIEVLLDMPYWGPIYQAWEPFLIAYLQSGVAPSFASSWLPKLRSKIEELGPRHSKYHNVFSELQRMYRSTSVECFAGYQWSEIENFVERIPVYIDNRRTINKFLFDKQRYTDLLTAMLAEPDKLPYAAYLYRHCMIEFIEYDTALLEKFQSLLNNYVGAFSESFDQVVEFVGETTDVYQWYTPEVKKIICNAWATTLDMTSKRKLITNTDVFNMPVWLSEQLTDYIASLPCTYTVQPDGVFILDALEYALDKSASMTDPAMIYAFCIPKDYVKSFADRLSQFYWDVKEGRFVQQLRAMESAQYQKGDSDVLPPDLYVTDLINRGFPVEGV